jgi:glycosyltransferase involved in cell wall biosynthesis
MTPTVSVVAIFLDMERYLSETVESVLAQSFTDWELLLVDDGSTDASSDIAQRFVADHPERIRYLSHPGHANRGMSASRNLGIEKVRGRYVALLDTDDVWEPNKLERQVALLEANPAADVCLGTPQYWLSWSGHAIDRPRDRPFQLPCAADRLIDGVQLMSRWFPLGPVPPPVPSDLLIRKAFIDRVGAFEEQFPGHFEDQAWLAKAYLAGQFYLSSECWTRYRRRTDSYSASHDGTYRAELDRYLSWLEAYLRQQPSVPPAIWQALRQARYQQRHPWLDFARRPWVFIRVWLRRALQIN